ncbi:helix-turn-helix domain-containing protein [Streptomyces sp. NPDC102340]|uniref:helix-turn-helix domain-containing protein n=1 Tax=unclassified Streptomyces TaxID=2593676 RepID=UPI0038214FF6
MSLAHQLRATVATLLHETGKTQTELADAIGVSPAQVSRRQSGTAMWSLDDCDTLAAHFGIDSLTLLAGPSAAIWAIQEARAHHNV